MPSLYLTEYGYPEYTKREKDQERNQPGKWASHCELCDYFPFVEHCVLETHRAIKTVPIARDYTLELDGKTILLRMPPMKPQNEVKPNWQ